MNGYWIALAAAAGFLIGYMVAILLVANREVDVAARLADELDAANRRIGLELYDQDAEDAVEFGARMIAELDGMVSSLRAVCYEVVAWIESLPQVGYRVSDVDALRIRLRAVLEDIEAMEEAR